ncbi:MAG: hypothetical protein K2F74_02210, partial [Muribaculaceae bacterium]|nr:hypothetical protein [Muribaculaceae bacterium]
TRSDKYGPHNSDNPAAAFGSLSDDCTRRDLTINSLYYDISSDKILDLSGMALDDIAGHVIRTPAEPRQTFDDDPLRIVRCIRFACSLGWNIHPDTYEAIKENPESIRIASKERIRNEFDKILGCPKPHKALDLLEKCGIMSVIMPELKPIFGMPDNSSNEGSVWQHTLRTVKAMSEITDDITLRLAALLCDAGKAVSFTKRKDGSVCFPGHDRRAPLVIDAAMRRLRYEPKIINEIIFLAKNHTAAKSWGDKAENMTDAMLRKLQYVCGTSARFNQLLTLIHADNLSQTGNPDRAGQIPAIRRRAAAFKAEHSEMFGYRLPIQSMHIRRILQIPAGRQVEQCKEYLMNLAFENPLLNREKFRRILTERYAKTAKIKLQK